MQVNSTRLGLLLSTSSQSTGPRVYGTSQRIQVLICPYTDDIALPRIKKKSTMNQQMLTIENIINQRVNALTGVLDGLNGAHSKYVDARDALVRSNGKWVLPFQRLFH